MDPTTQRFACAHCDKTYARQDGLTKHRHNCAPYLQATGKTQKKFPCLQCGSTFARSDHLKEHIKGKHEQVTQLFPCTLPGCVRFFVWKSAARTHIKTEHVRCAESNCGWSGVSQDLPHHRRFAHEKMKKSKYCKHHPYCQYSIDSESKMYKLRAHEAYAHDFCPMTGCKFRSMQPDVMDHLGSGQHIFDDVENGNKENTNAVASSSKVPPTQTDSSRDVPQASTSANTSTHAKGSTSYKSGSSESGAHDLDDTARVETENAGGKKKAEASLISVPIQGVERLKILEEHGVSTREAYETIAREADALFTHAVRLTIKYGDLKFMPNYILPTLVQEIVRRNWLGHHAAVLAGSHADYSSVLDPSTLSLLSPFYTVPNVPSGAALDFSRLPLALNGSLNGSIEIYDAFVTEWQELMGIADITPLLHQGLQQSSPFKPLHIQHLLALVFAEWNPHHVRLWTPFAAYLVLTQKFKPKKPKAGKDDHEKLELNSTLAQSSNLAIAIQDLKDLAARGDDAKNVFEGILKVARVSAAAWLIMLACPGMTVDRSPDASVTTAVQAYLQIDRLCGPLVPLATQVLVARLATPTEAGGGVALECYGHADFPRIQTTSNWVSFVRALYERNPAFTSKQDTRSLIRDAIQSVGRSFHQLRTQPITTEEMSQVFIKVFTNGPLLRAIDNVPQRANDFIGLCRDVVQESLAKLAMEANDDSHIVKDGSDWTEADIQKLDIIYQLNGSFNGANELIALMLPLHTLGSARQVVYRFSTRWIDQERSPAKLTELLNQAGMSSEMVQRCLQFIKPHRELRVGKEIA